MKVTIDIPDTAVVLTYQYVFEDDNQGHILCENCSYYLDSDCTRTAVMDAHDCIQQLEAKVEKLERVRADLTATNMQLRDVVFKNELFKRRLEEERSVFEAQVPRWISVEERLPDKRKHVLVFKQRTDHAIYPVAMWHIETDWRGEDGWSNNQDNGYFDVTHWMPMPKPPKEE